MIKSIQNNNSTQQHPHYRRFNKYFHNNLLNENIIINVDADGDFDQCLLHKMIKSVSIQKQGQHILQNKKLVLNNIK
jgi:hypothetical protein